MNTRLGPFFAFITAAKITQTPANERKALIDNLLKIGHINKQQHINLMKVITDLETQNKHDKTI